MAPPDKSPPLQRCYSSKYGKPVNALPSTTVSLKSVSCRNSLKKPISTTTTAGAVDEEWFLKAFKEKIEVRLYSAREFDDHFTKIKETILNTNIEWKKRVDALKRLRGLINTETTTFSSFQSCLRVLVPPFQTALKDLRSQVIREACVTIAFLAHTLKNKLDHFSECVMQHLLMLITNSAKVVASSGIVTIKFILQNVHASRLIPIVTYHSSSKSKEIRKAVFEFVYMVVNIWSTHSLGKHITILREAIYKGIADADVDARSFSRRAFWKYRDHFLEQSNALLNSLDVSQQKQLQSEYKLQSLSRPATLLTQQVTKTASTPQQSETTARHTTPTHPATPARPNSSTDLHAAQQKNGVRQYPIMSVQEVKSGASLPHPRKTASRIRPCSVGSVGSAAQTNRTQDNLLATSLSQPRSCSGSPSSRLNYTINSKKYSSTNELNSITFGRTRKSKPTSGIYETSSNRQRGNIQTFGNKITARSIADTLSLHSPKGKPDTGHKNLCQSLEIKSRLVEALNLEPLENLNRRGTRLTSFKSLCCLVENYYDNSGTSTKGSLRFFDVFKRNSDFYSRSDLQWKFSKDVRKPAARGISNVIAKFESTHSIDHKEGLIELQAYLQAGNLLQSADLKQITDNFTNMFMNPHTNVFSLFLDTLNILIVGYKTELNFWLYVVLTRLLNKLGGDLLESIKNKIHKSLDVVKVSFPSNVQLLAVLKFLSDATQTPNARVKTAVCNYIMKLAAVTDPKLAFLPPSPGIKDTVMIALTRMISWTMGGSNNEGNELKRAAQETILALFNFNMPQVRLWFSLLPMEYQEAAANIFQVHVRKSSTSCSNGAVAQHTTLISEKNIRKQISQDLSLIQMSSGGGDVCDSSLMIEKSRTFENQFNYSPSRVKLLKVRDRSDTDTPERESYQRESFNTGAQTTRSSTDESEVIRKVVESLQSPIKCSDNSNHQTLMLNENEKKIALVQFIQLIRKSSCTTIMKHFKSILRVIFKQINSNDPVIKSLALVSLMEMIKKGELANLFNKYVELLVLIVLRAFKNGNKEVQCSAEGCAAAIASFLAPELVIRVLVPLIINGEYPINLNAIKALTKLVETRGRDSVQNHISDLMPCLIQAYDNKESSVRKSAVFCTVALYTSVGEDQLRPHLDSLHASKLKLLHLYFKRAEQGSSEKK